MAKKKEVIEVVAEKTIHDKYRKHIESVKQGYITGLEYADAIDILRWCQVKLNQQIGLNYSCAGCLIDLVEMFSNLEDKK